PCVTQTVTPAGSALEDGFVQHVVNVRVEGQALADGVLVDVTATAREAGIKYPTAVTAAVWERCVQVPASVACQDEAGRLWDVLFLQPTSSACKRPRRGTGRRLAGKGPRAPQNRSRPADDPGGPAKPVWEHSGVAFAKTRRV